MWNLARPYDLGDNGRGERLDLAEHLLEGYWVRAGVMVDPVEVALVRDLRGALTADLPTPEIVYVQEAVFGPGIGEVR
jgi:hypothetical protein